MEMLRQELSSVSQELRECKKKLSEHAIDNLEQREKNVKKVENAAIRSGRRLSDIVRIMSGADGVGPLEFEFGGR